MKKLTAWALLLAMCVAMFAGCSTVNPNATTANVPDTTAGATAEDYLADAKAYLRTMYLSKAGKVLRDFDVVSQVKIGNFTYDIDWTTDAIEENVKISAPEEIAYRSGWITTEQLLESAKMYGKSPYGAHLQRVAEDKIKVLK